MSRSRFVLPAILLGFAAVSTGAPPLDRAKTEAVDRILDAWMKKSGIPGLSAAIALDGELVWSRGYGIADVENSVAAKPETVYRSASIGKPITATAAMRLVEQGKLDLDLPVERYCPAFPRKKWAVTSRHLLTHTSGIRHYGGPRDREEQTSTVHYKDVVDALAPFRDDPLLFEPGTKYSYSTYGFDVLGCGIQGAAGRPFMDVIRSLVFEPAGMKRSRDDDPFAVIPNRAAGYVREKGELKNAPHVDMSNRLPAGGYATTAPDLALFAASFIDCKLVSCEMRDAMLTPQTLKNGEAIDYGFGWGLATGQNWYGETEAFHGGSSPGASGMIYLLPRRRFAVVFLSNLESAPQRMETAAAIAKLVLDLGTKK
jgi:CubicO group peptidase (beta-lactamase class C family)